MDKSKKYIEMCEKAATDLGGAYDKPPDHSDFIAMEQTVGQRNFEVMCGLAMWRRLAPYDPISSNRLIIKLYKQDQLQEMIMDGESFIAKLSQFINSMLTRAGLGHFVSRPNTHQFGSMEQLWLAFVMKEKYNKIWNGKEWVK